MSSTSFGNNASNSTSVAVASVSKRATSTPVSVEMETLMVEWWKRKFAVQKDLGNSKGLSQRGCGSDASNQTHERVSFGISLTGGEVFRRRLTCHKTASAASAVVRRRTTNWRQP